MSEGDHFLESKPRPAPVVERLKDFCVGLAERAQGKVDVTLRLDAAAWAALRVDFQRPRHPKPERYFAMVGEWGICRFEKVEAPAHTTCKGLDVSEAVQELLERAGCAT